MRLKQVPFYANRPGGKPCILAAYRSVLEYFLHRQMTWDELEALTGFRADDDSWTAVAMERFTAMGFDVRVIENAVSGLPDVDAMLAEGRLVCATVNAAVLGSRSDQSGRSGPTERVILITDKIGDNYVAHDCGNDNNKPQANCHIAASTLGQALDNVAGRQSITGFKLSERHNLRLDQYVVGQYPLLSRAYAVRLIDEGKVLVDGQPAKAGYKLRRHDTITIAYDPAQEPAIPSIELPVLYEDDDCLVIDKPAGVLTHSVGKLHGEATVATFLRNRLAEQGKAMAALPAAGIRNSQVNQSNLRAGIVHRLDRATSGVIICAKHQDALAALQKQFHDRSALKTYAAVVSGQPEPAEAVIDMPIERNPKTPSTFRVGPNGKPAVTRYRTLATDGRHSLLELQPQTGRTHQLRVHLAARHHAIVGDFLYGGEPADRLYLHARQLDITLPSGTRRVFSAALPDTFAQLIRSVP